MNLIDHYIAKLISEEVLAFETYKNLELSFSESDRFQKAVIDLLDEISNDEFSDHAKKLIAYARSKNIDIPKDNNSYLKFAGEKAGKAFNFVPNTSDSDKLIEFALDLEGDAIKSYENAIKAIFDLDSDPKLLEILYHNLEDEIEHYDQLLVAASI